MFHLYYRMCQMLLMVGQTFTFQLVLVFWKGMRIFLQLCSLHWLSFQFRRSEILMLGFILLTNFVSALSEQTMVLLERLSKCHFNCFRISKCPYMIPKTAQNRFHPCLLALPLFSSYLMMYCFFIHLCICPGNTQALLRDVHKCVDKSKGMK